MSVMREKKQVLNIHLLQEDAFKNKAPQKLLAQSLAAEQDATNKNVKAIGMKPVKNYERPRDDRGHDQGGRGGDGGHGKSSYNRNRSKRTAQQSQGAKAHESKKSVADVKDLQGDFGDDYKNMMGKHWNGIEESLQGSKEKAPGGALSTKK